MTDVTDIATARQERTPHVGGEARCLACKHEWAGVAPAGTEWLECPGCGMLRGRFVGPVIPETHWQCNCGCDLFYATADALICPNCGERQHGF